jgi:hypothetical protein
MSTTAKEVNSTEVYQLLDHLTGIQDIGSVIRPLFIWGKPGLGKTEMVRDYAISKGMEFAYCAPAQWEEMGDLHGIPQVEGGVTVYRKPSWLPENNGKPGILLLDDFNRADPRIIRGLMQLSQLHELMSWKLPDNWIIVCTGNPDNSDFSTTMLDDAVMTRFIHVRVRFDKMAWARWAVENGVPPEGVNFILTYPELIEKGKLTNARTITSFFKLISKLKPWNDHAGLIETLGLGLLDEETLVSYFKFMKEINAMIPSPETILYGPDTDKLEKEMRALLVQPGGIRLDLFSTMFTRLMIACGRQTNRKINSSNLVKMFTLEEIPNDFRTHMFVEFGKLTHPELIAILKDKSISMAILKAS